MPHMRNVCFALIFCLSVIAEPPYVLPEGGVAALSLGVPDHRDPHAVRETIDVAHPAFREALRVRVLRPSQHVHQIQLNRLSAVDLAQGDILCVRMTLRSGSDSGEPIRVPFFVQDRQQGFRSLFDRNVVAGTEWEDVVFTFPVAEDLEAGRIQFCLFLGGESQTVDIGRFEVVNLGGTPGDSALPPDSVRSISVQGEFLPVASPRETITDSLPAGWEEDSAWADVEVNYRPQFINPFEGDRSLRAEVLSLRQGTVQFRMPDVLVTPSHLMRIRIPVRSEDNLSGTISLRQRGAPYATHWSAPLAARRNGVWWSFWPACGTPTQKPRS